MFIIKPDVLKNEAKKKTTIDHSLHAIFIKSNDGVNYHGKNSWGTNWPDISISMDQFEERSVTVFKDVTKSCCECITSEKLKKKKKIKMLIGVDSYFRVEIDELVQHKMDNQPGYVYVS